MHQMLNMLKNGIVQNFMLKVFTITPKLHLECFLLLKIRYQLLSVKEKKNKYLKRANKMLKEEFGNEIKNMSITRGTYLMKLIFKNTG